MGKWPLNKKESYIYTHGLCHLLAECLKNLEVGEPVVVSPLNHPEKNWSHMAIRLKDGLIVDGAGIYIENDFKKLWHANGYNGMYLIDFNRDDFWSYMKNNHHSAPGGIPEVAERIVNFLKENELL